VGFVRGYIGELSVWGKAVRELFLWGVSIGGSLSGRLRTGVGYSMGLARVICLGYLARGAFVSEVYPLGPPRGFLKNCTVLE